MKDHFHSTKLNEKLSETERANSISALVHLPVKNEKVIQKDDSYFYYCFLRLEEECSNLE